MTEKTNKLTSASFLELLRKGETDFHGAKFERDTHLCYLNLEGINLKRAEMNHVCFYKTNLKGTNLYNARMFFSFMQYVDFSSADMRGVALSHSDMRFSILTDAKMSGSAMCGVKLAGAVGTESCDLNKTYFLDAEVTAQQEKNILDRYKLIKEPVKGHIELPSHPYIHTLENNEPFITVKAGARSRT